MTAARRNARRALVIVAWSIVTGRVATAQSDQSSTWGEVQYFGGAAGVRGNSPHADNTLTISPGVIQLRNKHSDLLFEITTDRIEAVDHLPDRYLSLEYAATDCRRAAVLLRAKKGDLPEIFKTLLDRQAAQKARACPEQDGPNRVATDGSAAKSRTSPLGLEVKLAAVEEILVLPTVDVRSGEKASVKLDDIQVEAVRLLRRKNYAAKAAERSEDVSEIIDDDLKEAKPEWVKALGPPEARWVLVVCLGDLTSKMTFGSTGNAEVSGYLYDKQAARLVWYAKGIGQVGQGGLAGMAVKGWMKSDALRGAMRNLMRTIPKRRKAGSE